MEQTIDPAECTAEIDHLRASGMIDDEEEQTLRAMVETNPVEAKKRLDAIGARLYGGNSVVVSNPTPTPYPWG